MKVEFDESFHKSLIKIKDKALLSKVKLIIKQAEQADGVYDIPHITKNGRLQVILSYTNW